MLQLFTDTDTDITPEDAKEYGYKLKSYIPGQSPYKIAKEAGFESNAFKMEIMGEEFTCGGAYATVVVLAVVDAILVAGAGASIVLSRKK